MAVEADAQVLHVDEDVTVLEIVGVREGVIEIIEALMMQLHQEVLILMCKSEFAASGRIGSMKAVHITMYPFNPLERRCAAILM